MLISTSLNGIGVGMSTDGMSPQQSVAGDVSEDEVGDINVDDSDSQHSNASNISQSHHLNHHHAQRLMQSDSDRQSEDSAGSCAAVSSHHASTASLLRNNTGEALTFSISRLLAPNNHHRNDGSAASSPHAASIPTSGPSPDHQQQSQIAAQTSAAAALPGGYLAGLYASGGLAGMVYGSAQAGAGAGAGAGVLRVPAHRSMGPLSAPLAGWGALGALHPAAALAHQAVKDRLAGEDLYTYRISYF